MGAKGYFDPKVGGVTSFQKNIAPVASSLGGSTTGSVINRNSLADPTVSGSLPRFGTTYQVDYSSSRTSTNNSFAQLNPQYPLSMNFSITQPLWRNLRYDDNRHRLEAAKKNVYLTDEQFRQRVMQIVTQTEQAYWDLTFAYGNLEVQLEAVNLGREQDESNRRQEEQGLLAPIDVVAAQRQLATFEVNAYSAQEALTAAEEYLEDADTSRSQRSYVVERADTDHSGKCIAARDTVAGCGARRSRQEAGARAGRNHRRDQRD